MEEEEEENQIRAARENGINALHPARRFHDINEVISVQHA